MSPVANTPASAVVDPGANSPTPSAVVDPGADSLAHAAAMPSVMMQSSSILVPCAIIPDAHLLVVKVAQPDHRPVQCHPMDILRVECSHHQSR
jgi:hypothetical protein